MNLDALFLFSFPAFSDWTQLKLMLTMVMI